MALIVHWIFYLWCVLYDHYPVEFDSLTEKLRNLLISWILFFNVSTFNHPVLCVYNVVFVRDSEANYSSSNSSENAFHHISLGVERTLQLLLNWNYGSTHTRIYQSTEIRGHKTNVLYKQFRTSMNNSRWATHQRQISDFLSPQYQRVLCNGVLYKHQRIH